MDSLQDLLGHYGPHEPAEITAIKRYISEQFSSPSSVMAQKETFVITVGSASLANALRLQTLKIQAAAQTSKRLLFRIG